MDSVPLPPLIKIFNFDKNISYNYSTISFNVNEDIDLNNFLRRADIINREKKIFYVSLKSKDSDLFFVVV